MGRPTNEQIDKLPLYKFPGNETQREHNFNVMRAQTAKLNAFLGFLQTKLFITCGECGESYAWWFMYRCLYCDIWFCKRCAQLHFGRRLPNATERSVALEKGE